MRDFQHLLDGQCRDLEPSADALQLASELPAEDIVRRAAVYVRAG